MGVSLLTPQGSNFIKDFVGQNAHNCDQIDAYAGPCLTSHPLQTYTPELTGDTTNPVLGTGGFIRGFYYQIFDQIYTWGEFRFGSSGFNIGMGLYAVSLPFAANNTMGVTNTPGSAPIVGSGSTYDDSSNAGRLPLTVHLRTASTQLFFGIRMNSGSSFRELREAGHITWAANDGVTWFARMQRAV